MNNKFFFITGYLIIFNLFIFNSHLCSQSSVFQEEQDFHFAHQLAGRGMYDVAAVQFLSYAQLYPQDVGLCLLSIRFSLKKSEKILGNSTEVLGES